MAGEVPAAERVAQQIKYALEAADLSAFGDLLDPDVHWGAPGDAAPPCRNREQVLRWYERGRQAGVRARVMETTVLGEQAILVGLKVTGRPGAGTAEGERWQVLTLKAGRVAQIVAFDTRGEALAHAGS